MADVGLRERKLTESKLKTEKAAVSLCLKHGFHDVTVDMICEEAGISARTFYNYFGTREVALLGTGKPQPKDADIEAYIAHRDVSEVEAFLTLMSTTYDEHAVDRELIRNRRRLMDTTPELAALNFARMAEARGQYQEIITMRLGIIAPELSSAARADRARMVLAVSMGTMQVVGRGWIFSDSDASLNDVMQDTFAQLRDITQTTPATQTTRPTGEQNN